MLLIKSNYKINVTVLDYTTKSLTNTSRYNSLFRNTQYKWMKRIQKQSCLTNSMDAKADGHRLGKLGENRKRSGPGQLLHNTVPGDGIWRKHELEV